MARAMSVRGQARFGLAALFAATLAGAASFSVLPVRVELAAKNPVGALTVRNNGNEAAVVQLEASQWTQADGKDAYLATRDILATPPIFTIAPGASQIVRVGLRRNVDPTQELSYRLFLQEVPPAPAADFKGLRMVLRMSVPVFVAPIADPAKPADRLEWRAGMRGGRTELSVTNRGTRHVEFTRLELDRAADHAALFRQYVQTYVLPGQRQSWPIELAPMPALGTALRLDAASDAGAIATDLEIDAR